MIACKENIIPGLRFWTLDLADILVVVTKKLQVWSKRRRSVKVWRSRKLIFGLMGLNLIHSKIIWDFRFQLSKQLFSSPWNWIEHKLTNRIFLHFPLNSLTIFEYLTSLSWSKLAMYVKIGWIQVETWNFFTYFLPNMYGIKWVNLTCWLKYICLVWMELNLMQHETNP